MISMCENNSQVPGPISMKRLKLVSFRGLNVRSIYRKGKRVKS